MNKLKSILKDKALIYGIKIENEKLDMFDDYKNFLLEWNNKMNLTAITEVEDIAVKHFLDSILIFKYIDIERNSKIIDIGAGAGFPSVPIKILDNSISLTLVDSLNKKVSFLDNLINFLNLDKSNAIHSRAEILGKDLQFREKYDYCLARAVSNLTELVEYCLPFVKVGGTFVSYKGFDIENELDNARNAIKILGGEIKDVIKYSVLDKYKRSMIVIKKISQTSTLYPRNSSKISKSPLN